MSQSYFGLGLCFLLCGCSGAAEAQLVVAPQQATTIAEADPPRAYQRVAAPPLDLSFDLASGLEMVAQASQSDVTSTRQIRVVHRTDAEPVTCAILGRAVANEGMTMKPDRLAKVMEHGFTSVSIPPHPAMLGSFQGLDASGQCGEGSCRSRGAVVGRAIYQATAFANPACGDAVRLLDSIRISPSETVFGDPDGAFTVLVPFVAVHATKEYEGYAIHSFWLDEQTVLAISCFPIQDTVTDERLRRAATGVASHDGGKVTSMRPIRRGEVQGLEATGENHKGQTRARVFPSARSTCIQTVTASSAAALTDATATRFFDTLQLFLP